MLRSEMVTNQNNQAVAMTLSLEMTEVEQIMTSGIMEAASTHEQDQQPAAGGRHHALASIILSGCMLAVGDIIAPILFRIYFKHGGKRIWLASTLMTAAWPLAILPLFLSYFNRKKHNSNATFLTANRFLFVTWAVVGTLVGVVDYLFSHGASFLPASTASLLMSTQLIFTAFFAVFLVKQRFTPYSVNAIFLLTLGAVVLGVNNKGDRPPNVSHGHYLIGFIFIIGAALLYGLLMPLIQLAYEKATRGITATLVLESHIIMSIFATSFCALGMLCSKDVQAIPREASEYELGKAKYYLILIGSSIGWQLFFLGVVAMVASSSSLEGGILITAVTPVKQVLAVFFLKEKFGVGKGISLALCFWGFSSYLYGEMKKPKPENPASNVVVEN